MTTAQQTDFTIEEILSEGTHARLRVTGELDIATSDLLETALDEQLAMPRHFVGVDLTELTFCDGTGLGMLDRVYSRFHAVGGALTLTGVSAQLTRLMNITALASLLACSTPRLNVSMRQAPAVSGRAHGHLRSV